jgi:hypothetical protein
MNTLARPAFRSDLRKPPPDLSGLLRLAIIVELFFEPYCLDLCGKTLTG